MIVDSLRRIGCNKTANITQKSCGSYWRFSLTEEAIDTVMTSDDEQRPAKLNRCDDAYYKNAEPIAERLFEFIKANRVGITL